MHKKLLVWFMIVTILIGTMGISSAASYTLPEKMTKQIQVGSGIKGAFTVESEGKSDFTLLLSKLNGKEIQFRGIQSENKELYSFYTENESGIQEGLTQLYVEDGLNILSSVSFGNSSFSWNDISSALDMLKTQNGQNLSFDSALRQFFSVTEEEWKTRWETVINEYYKLIEAWISKYALTPNTVKTDDGDTAIEIRYEIDDDSLKDGICSLLEAALSDNALVELLKEKMTEEQQLLYLNKELMYYYREVIKRVVLKGNVILSRTVSTKGNIISATIELPMVETIPGFNRLILTSVDDSLQYHLIGPGGSIELTIFQDCVTENSLSKKADLIIIPSVESGKEWYGRYLAYHLSFTDSFSNDFIDEKQHESERLEFKAIPDATLAEVQLRPLYTDMKQIRLTIDLHYSSKTAQTSPTTLELSIDSEYGDDIIKIIGKIKTTSSWELIPPTVENVRNITELDLVTLQSVIENAFNKIQ